MKSENELRAEGLEMFATYIAEMAAKDGTPDSEKMSYASNEAWDYAQFLRSKDAE